MVFRLGSPHESAWVRTSRFRPSRSAEAERWPVLAGMMDKNLFLTLPSSDEIFLYNIKNEMNTVILQKVLTGLSDKNIRFVDIRNLIADLGFKERRKWDHHIFSKEGVTEIIHIQPLKDGKAKAYQVKQIRNLILKYKLHQEGKNV